MQRETLGRLLVLAQFGLIAALVAWSLPSFLAGRSPIGAWLLAISGIGVGLSALAANRPSNFNVRPTPREGGQLAVGGAYRWIRHPMYSCVMLLGAACAWSRGTAESWAAAIALVLVLSIKASIEERWLQEVFPQYAAYRLRTRRFIPGIY